MPSENAVFASSTGSAFLSLGRSDWIISCLHEPLQAKNSLLLHLRAVSSSSFVNAEKTLYVMLLVASLVIFAWNTSSPPFSAICFSLHSITFLQYWPSMKKAFLALLSPALKNFSFAAKYSSVLFSFCPFAFVIFHHHFCKFFTKLIIQRLRYKCYVQ